MIFNQPDFVMLFVVSAALFFLSPVQWRRLVLIGSGLVFYTWYARPFLPLVLVLVIVTYLVSGRIGVWVNVLALAGLMAYFKIRGGASILATTLAADQSVRKAVFPLGLSFLAFELIHYSVERKRGTIPRASLASLAAFALYFPCRMAGPIKRYRPFEASIIDSRWSIQQTYYGLVRILWGFVKKVAIADVLALIAAELNFEATSLHSWKALVAYSFYIFLDFSAYSDIAIGMSRCLGLQVPENFQWPYLSPNIRLFWNRWHMSLSSWLGDYLFLPISRGLVHFPVRLSPKLVTIAAYLSTFMICGLWHGPSLNFLLWGLYHGVCLSCYALYHSSRDSVDRPKMPAPLAWLLGRVISPLATFGVATLGWVLFAMPLPQAVKLYAVLFGLRGG